jgi:hypothetical protein
MARFEAATLGMGVVLDVSGNVQVSQPFTLAGGPLYAAETGGTTLSGASLITNATTGELPGWFDPDTDPGIYTLTIGAKTRKFMVGDSTRVDALESNGGPAKLGADNKFLGNSASDAEFRALYGEPGSPPLDSPTISVQKAGTAASTQHGGGFFGVISAAGSLSAANNVGVYGFAEEDRVSPTGGTWGANFGARADATGPANVQGCEVDIVNNVAHSGTTASGALGVLGLSIASGGPFRPLTALDIATNAAPFVYGIRFAEGAVYASGAVVQSLTTDPTQVQWEVFDYDAASGYSNPLFTFNASGKLSWGAGGASALDMTLERATIIAGQVGLKAGGAFEVVAGAKICSFSAGQTLSFFGAAGASQATITGSRGGTTATVLGALLTALGNHGLITDSTTA